MRRDIVADKIGRAADKEATLVISMAWPRYFDAAIGRKGAFAFSLETVFVFWENRGTTSATGAETLATTSRQAQGMLRPAAGNEQRA